MSLHPTAAQIQDGSQDPTDLCLEFLLEESNQHAADTFSLEDLLNESMASVKEAQDAKALRQRIASGGMSKEEAKESNALLRSWEARREWNKTANTITFSRAFCACCNSYYPVFQSFGEEQTHRHNQITRWVKVDEHKNLELPKKVIYEDTVIPMCEECAAGAGWPVEIDS